MEQKTGRFYQSAPQENKNIDSEQRLENKLNDMDRFNESANKIKQLITKFEDKNRKSKKN